jgi:hypothetical protein
VGRLGLRQAGAAGGRHCGGITAQPDLPVAYIGTPTGRVNPKKSKSPTMVQSRSRLRSGPARGRLCGSEWTYLEGDYEPGRETEKDGQEKASTSWY